VNLVTVRYLSRALGRHVAYTVLVPDRDRHGPGPFPVLYQLHGRSDDHTAWVHFSRLVHHVAPYPFLVVLPDGGLSWWCNAGPRERYEDFVVEDLAAHVAATFHVRPGRAAVGGLSMGGGGALRLALKHPHRFASVWAHSSAIPTAARLAERLGLPQEAAEADDAYRLAERLVATTPRLDWPRIAFDCGLDDPLLEDNRAFHRHLEALGLPHAYREHPGGHTWEYWDRHVVEALAHHAAVLGLARA
jgi:putative tributyrin esterase